MDKPIPNWLRYGLVFASVSFVANAVNLYLIDLDRLSSGSGGGLFGLEGGETVNGIIRAFCEQTSNTPRDEYCFIGEPGLFIPHHKEVHVSCVFTWDKPYAEHLVECWRAIGSKVKLGGPAYDDAGGDYVPGMYARKRHYIHIKRLPKQL